MKCLIFPGFFKFSTAEISKKLFFQSDYRQTCTGMNEQNVKDGRSADVSLLRYILNKLMLTVSSDVSIQAAICYYELTVNHQAYDMNDNVQWGRAHHTPKFPYFSQMYISFELTNERRISMRQGQCPDATDFSLVHWFFSTPLVLAQPKFEPKPPIQHTICIQLTRCVQSCMLSNNSKPFISGNLTCWHYISLTREMSCFYTRWANLSSFEKTLSRTFCLHKRLFKDICHRKVMQITKF